jgi:hypothetical protein
MSPRRWAGTAVVMAAVGWALTELSPGLPQLQAAAADPQRYVDTAGADALVLLVVPALAWLCWAWGVLGLLLTAASTAPGWTGRLAGRLAAGVLPAGARQAAALALGVGLSTAAPVLLPPAAVPFAVVSAMADDDTGAVPPVLVDGPAVEPTPDWPSVPAGAPDWPRASAEDHVVLRGDCLWDIAAGWLRTQRPEQPATDAEVLRAVHAWWDANADVIGADPDVLLPGQVLRPPG